MKINNIPQSYNVREHSHVYNGEKLSNFPEGPHKDQLEYFHSPKGSHQDKTKYIHSPERPHFTKEYGQKGFSSPEGPILSHKRENV